MLYFQGFEGVFCVRMVIFGDVKNGEMLDFSIFCRTQYRTRKWRFGCENIRYAIPASRLSVLKCKPRPHHGIKTYHNSTVLWYVFIVSSKNALHLAMIQFAILVKQKHLTRFRGSTSVLSK